MIYKRLLYSLPAPLCLLAITVLLGMAIWNRRGIENRYRAAARNAMKEGDLESARVYYARLIDGKRSVAPEDELNWVQLLAANGQHFEARELLEKLAPDATPGYGPAHRFRAQMLAAESQVDARDGTVSPDLLEKWHWHLREGVRDESNEADQLWAAYFLLVGQPEDAVRRLESAARRDPRLWLQVATLTRAMGDDASSERYLKQSLESARERIDDDAHSVDDWLMLVRTLVAQGKLDEAETAVEAGLRVVNDPKLTRAASDLALFRYDAADPENIPERIRFLAKASKLDRNNPAVYSRLIKFYTQESDAERKEQLRDSLAKSIAEGNEAAFAHFALGSIYFLEHDQDKSLLHIEQAYRQLPEMLEVANNLAWLLANSEQKDLKRAEELIRSVIDRQPNDLRYRDTLASVLEGQERWSDALVELELILPKTPTQERSNLHERLANVYRNLGQDDMAKLHEDKVQ